MHCLLIFAALPRLGDNSPHFISQHVAWLLITCLEFKLQPSAQLNVKTAIYMKHWSATPCIYMSAPSTLNCIAGHHHFAGDKVDSWQLNHFSSLQIFEDRQRHCRHKFHSNAACVSIYVYVYVRVRVFFFFFLFVFVYMYVCIYRHVNHLRFPDFFKRLILITLFHMSAHKLNSVITFLKWDHACSSLFNSLSTLK